MTMSYIIYITTYICMYLITRFTDSIVTASNTLRHDNWGNYSGTFYHIHTNSRLNVDQSVEIRDTQIHECTDLCKSGSECKAISFSKSEKLCLLHSETIAKDKNNLEKIDGWVFYQSTDKVQRKSSSYCSNYNPCKSRECEDLRERTWYKCECDHCYFGEKCQTHGSDLEWVWSEWSVWSIPFSKNSTRSRKAMFKIQSEEDNFVNCGGVLQSEIGKCTYTHKCPLVLASYYTNLPDIGLEYVENTGKFAEAPDYQKIFNEINIPDVVGDYIAVRLTTYFLAPETGVYTFKTNCDDSCKLYLSTDVNPENKVQIAYQRAAAGIGNYNEYPDQTSDQVNLNKGNAYHFEVRLFEETVLSYVSIGVVLPNGTFDAPIGSKYLTTNEA